jgi:hypothetical protein
MLDGKPWSCKILCEYNTMISSKKVRLVKVFNRKWVVLAGVYY